MVSNPKRKVRTGMDGKPFRCPFCPGNEADTPPEVFRIGDGEANKPGWKVRVVPNLFPITDYHEVIIHSPDHDKNIEDLTEENVVNIIKTYINRFNFLKDKGKVHIFSNQSLISGASLIHSHSQIAVVPHEIPENIVIKQPVVNIVEQIGDFVSYCPTYSEWSYEVWIAEKISNDKLQMPNEFQNLNEEKIKSLSKILQSSIKKLKKIHDGDPHYAKKPFGYNFYISILQAPQVHPTGVLEEGWYLRIIPRFMERAGFEFSTGIMVNSVTAETASDNLAKA